MRSLLCLLVASWACSTHAHMSIFLSSMYGVGPNYASDAGDPVSPMSGLEKDDWWFRGAQARALAPPKGEVTELPAGGEVLVEIACNVAWTSLGARTTDPTTEPLDACPGNAGAYHAPNSNPSIDAIDDSLSSGCALAIADVSDIGLVTWDNLVVFSVVRECVTQRDTYFNVPAMMPACSGPKCICAWLWLANNGTANFYMTAFDCKTTHVSHYATPISPPHDPVFCLPGTGCTPTAGAKRPLYSYNNPTNVQWEGNNARPGYHPGWSFNDGAQNDIFEPMRKGGPLLLAGTSHSSNGTTASLSASHHTALPPAAVAGSTLHDPKAKYRSRPHSHPHKNRKNKSHSKQHRVDHQYLAGTTRDKSNFLLGGGAHPPVRKEVHHRVRPSHPPHHKVKETLRPRPQLEEILPIRKPFVPVAPSSYASASHSMPKGVTANASTTGDLLYISDPLFIPPVVSSSVAPSSSPVGKKWTLVIVGMGIGILL